MDLMEVNYSQECPRTIGMTALFPCPDSDQETDCSEEEALEQNWLIMEQSLVKLRLLQRHASGDAERQRLLVRETLRRASWAVVVSVCSDRALGYRCGRLSGLSMTSVAPDSFETPYSRAMLMAHILDQCLSRLGLLGRIKLIIEPPPDGPDSGSLEPPFIKLPLNRRTSLTN